MTEDTVRELQRFCSKLARRKLVFIANNDRGVELEDLSGELVSHAYSAVLRYEPESELHALNIAKKAARNHMIRMIEHHTAKKRCRVVSTHDGYAPTTLSLDLIEENGMTPETLHGNHDAGQAEEDATLESKMRHLPEAVSSIVKIVLGGSDENFEAWLGSGEVGDRELVAKACEYYNVPLDGLRMVLQVWNPSLEEALQ